jgi:hypothetical protein
VGSEMCIRDRIQAISNSLLALNAEQKPASAGFLLNNILSIMQFHLRRPRTSLYFKEKQNGTSN